MRRRVFANVSEQLVVVVLPGRRIHGESPIEGIGRLGRVPGVDDQGAVKRVSGTGKFGEDENSVALLLAGDVLVGDLCGG